MALDGGAIPLEKTIAVGGTGAKVKCDSQAHFTYARSCIN